VFPSDLDQTTLDAVREICRHHLNCLVGTEATSSLWRAVYGIATDCLIFIAYGALRGSNDWLALERLFTALGPEHPIWEPSPEQAGPYRELCELTHRLARSGKAAGGLGRFLAETQSAAVDDTLAGNIVYAVEMGRYDLAGLLRWNMKTLSDVPCVVERIRRGAEPDLPRAVVLETLRLHQSEGLSRIATCDLDVEGFRIPKKTFLRIAVRESHRDPMAFPDPLSFRPDRFIGTRVNPDKYAPFGLDRHRCIGADLVTAIGGIFVEELVRRYRWRVLADGPEHRGPYHWEPSRRFAITIETAPT
jgi:cytochrome P450